MPQTRFVLRRALEKGLKPIVVINKIDRENARIAEVVSLTQDLFLELATSADQLDFPVLYASAREGYCVADPNAEGGPDASVRNDSQEVPPPPIEKGNLQMLVSNLTTIAMGKIAIAGYSCGKIAPHDTVVVINKDAPQLSTRSHRCSHTWG